MVWGPTPDTQELWVHLGWKVTRLPKSLLQEFLKTSYFRPRGCCCLIFSPAKARPLARPSPSVRRDETHSVIKQSFLNTFHLPASSAPTPQPTALPCSPFFSVIHHSFLSFITYGVGALLLQEVCLGEQQQDCSASSKQPSEIRYYCPTPI